MTVESTYFSDMEAESDRRLIYNAEIYDIWSDCESLKRILSASQTFVYDTGKKAPILP